MLYDRALCHYTRLFDLTRAFLVVAPDGASPDSFPHGVGLGRTRFRTSNAECSVLRAASRAHGSSSATSFH